MNEEQAKYTSGLVLDGYDALNERLWELQTSKNFVNEDYDWLLKMKPMKLQSTSNDTPRKFKWATSLDTAEKDLFNQAKSLPCEKRLTQIIPSQKENRQEAINFQVHSIKKSTSGSIGVFFLMISDKFSPLKNSEAVEKRVLVVKPPSFGLSSDLLSSLLGLSLGIACPRTLMVWTESPFGGYLLESIKKKDPSWHSLTLFDQYRLLMKEYVIGYQWNDYNTTKINSPDYISPLELDNSQNYALYTSLGRLMALDVLLNNGDRLPLIWDNQGNPGNVFVARKEVAEGKHELIAVNIDGGARAIDPQQFPKESAQYFERAKLCVEEARGIYKAIKSGVELEKIPESSKFHRIALLLCDWSGSAVDDKTLGTMMKFMIVGFNQVVDLFGKGKQSEKSVFKHIMTIFNFIKSVDKRNQKTLGLESLNVGYFEKMCDIFETAACK